MRPPRTLSGSDTRAEGMRERAYGQEYEPTIVDRFGVWLSGYQIRKHTGSFGGKRIGDFGCGYHAAFVRSIIGEVEKAVLVDITLAHKIKKKQKITAIEGSMPQTMEEIAHDRLNIIMC